MATEERQLPKKKMSKEEEQTHRKDVQEKENIQEEAAEQQKKGKIAEETEEIEFDRSPPAAASTGTGPDAMSIPLTPTAQIIRMQGLLRRWASGGMGGLAREVRARSVEEQPSQPDQEVSRGRSMR